MKRLFSFVSILIFSFPLTGIAKVYKWTDENGKVHYSDKPFNEKSQTVNVGKEPSKELQQEAKREAEKRIKYNQKLREIGAQEAEEKREIDYKNEKAEKKRIWACNEAKRQIRILGSGRVVIMKDKSGEASGPSLSDQEKGQKIEELKKLIAENCEA